MKDERLSFKPLAGLRKALEEKRRDACQAVAPHSTPRRKGRGLIPEGKEHLPPEELLQEAMADVREITEFRALAEKCSPARVPSGPCEPCDRTMQDLRDLVRGKSRITLSDTDEYMEWTRKGVPSGLARRLHEGELSIQDSLDLHGLTADEAQEELGIFINESKRKGLSCVKVIHGRGLRSPDGPVLKEAAQQWLRRHSLAYATARHMDGGLGATYVLLRR
jgi:DNA-nicking Smr family endonuclease